MTHNIPRPLFIKIFIYDCFLTLIFFMSIGCERKLPEYTEIKADVALIPDYTSISVPQNIAPLNFFINEQARQYIVRFFNSDGTEFLIHSTNGKIIIPEKKWSKLVNNSRSQEYFIDVFTKKSEHWEKFKTITNYIVTDSIDKYLTYRLIDPGFITWKNMGIYQRNLENFEETPVMLNNFVDGDCINCHSFCKNNGNTMMFHIRGENGGTIIYNNNELSKVNTKTDSTLSAGVYPAWHPSESYIAYSVNNIAQSFHSLPEKKIEVFDTLSDIIIYDVRNNCVNTCQSLSDPGRLETFPGWSPDGRYLYFCCANKQDAKNHDQINYDLLRIDFDSDNGRFGTVDTVIFASDSGKSVSFHRISPDGNYLLFTSTNYGNFSIWHTESDLYLMNLTNGVISLPEINSSGSESYHTWSSTGRWIVFSSRREDGLYTHPYLSYFDSTGKAHKPFIMPQKNPGFYMNFMKSFNRPELITSKIELNPRRLAEISRSAAVKAIFKNKD